MEKIAVMYSGGVDSTLVADMAATDADEIYLLTCISNCHLKDETAEHAYERMRPRVKLLENRHPSKKFTHIILNSKKIQAYLWNHLAFKDLATVGLWRNQPCACCSSATFFRIFAFCLDHGIKRIYDGANVMMSNYPYQGIHCGELYASFCKKFLIEKISPIYWYDNEDVMMLYRIKGFKDDQYIQRHLIKGKSSNKEAQERGIVTGDMKYNFANKNKHQMLCGQEVFVNYSMFLFYYKRYDFVKMQKLMSKQLQNHLEEMEPILIQYQKSRKHQKLFCD